MGIQSVVRLLKTMEDLIKGDNSKEFWRTYRVGYTTFVLHKRQNHGTFLELSEYSNGGRQSFIIIPEGREGSR
jgi:hypothetical protein